MKLTKKQCRDIAGKITNEEILSMLEKAKNNIKDWQKPSNSNKKLSKGKIWNMLVKDLQDNIDNISIISVSDKYILLREYGEFIPFHLLEHKYPKPEKKKEKKLIHEEPVFKSDNNEDYYTECMRLLNKLLYLMHGNKCQICDTEFKDETYLMPVHILSKGAYKRMQFILDNVIWSCHKCHKDYDEGHGMKKGKVLSKMQVIKGDRDLIENLKFLYKETPLLKDQKVKETLQELINAYKVKATKAL